MRRERFKRAPETQRRKDEFVQELTCKGLAGGDAFLRPEFDPQNHMGKGENHLLPHVLWLAGAHGGTRAHTHKKTNISKRCSF